MMLYDTNVDSLYQSFRPQVSVVFILATLAVFALAIVLGRIGVRIMPRNFIRGIDSSKRIDDVTNVFPNSFARWDLRESDSVISLQSNLVAVIEAGVMLVILSSVFIIEHFDGLFQFSINWIHRNEWTSWRWALVIALLAMSFFMLFLGCLWLKLYYWSENLTACRMVGAYFSDGTMPVIIERQTKTEKMYCTIKEKLHARKMVKRARA